ncbi:SbcC/MukB-like Walker B domain-containing protein [Sulfuriroseicoccus oceanibius]|uniref:Uncharacterized protein n=1 Tax=Sulfuriroseicoccus oceanibius TaxID=2707525 RepID=A0A6B3L4W6_9BACT|nr:SbcC/MukB-like Walker B domain-containing protein [Sulfuriroseicoccus oceanibius]QQL44462.1 hypothetical protein G3M56_011280 [Sulfuriroseicoccus oceanibius]
MSKKIELTRIHAINWFGYQDVFDISGNLLIAGITGSGKSILMDLMQLVLIGDQKSKYNQSATGKASSRTLKSYCLGDTKDEIEGVPQYMRNEGATTYVALEFTWPDGQRKETWGLRIEFDSAAQNQPSRRHGFWLQGAMTKDDWIDAFDYPLDYAEFRDLTHERGGRVFDTMEAYRREMALPGHLNFDRETLDYLLPAAMSFTFLDNFNRFCRNYVLPPDEIRIQEVRDSYHAFLSLRHELAALNQQLDLLERIHKDYQTHHQSQIDRDLYADISRELAVEDLREQVQELEEEIEELQQQAEEETRRESELEEQLGANRGRRDLLRDAINATDEGQLYRHLKDESRELVRRIAELSEAGRNVSEARELRCRMIEKWMNQLGQAGIKLPTPLVKSVQKQMKAVNGDDLDQLPQNLELLADAVRDLHDASKDAEVPLREDAEKKINKIKALTNRLEALESGKLNHRTALLDAINMSLPRRRNGDPAAFALRELCEVKDERWRPALEVAFTRKFAVVTEPENYGYAESIYREMKAAAPGESLINPMQALELNATRRSGSLAEKLECAHPVAQSIVDHLFGRIICVEDARDLTKHDAAILPDGFSYRKPFAERRAHYDKIPCIGGRGLEQQRETLTKERTQLRRELERLQPLANLLNEAEQLFRSQRLDSPSLGAQLADLQKLHELEQRRAAVVEQLGTIEVADFEAKDQELREIELQIDQAEQELKDLRKSDLKMQIGGCQRSLDDASEKLERADTELKRFRAEGPNLRDHQTRRAELYKELTHEYPVTDVACSQAERFERKCAERAITARSELVEARKELARDFPAYNEFSPEDPGNGPWDERLTRIANSDIPAYENKAKREEKNWQEIFRKQVLVKLRSALMRVDMTLKLLNKELKKPIGHHVYQIRKKRNPDYATYQQLVDNSALADEGGLFFDTIDSETKDEVERIFNLLVDDPNNTEALNFLDYRNYYDYDMSVVDTRDPDARETSVDKQSGKFSGGENQSPYFIAILACYLRAYHRYERGSNNPSIGLVPIDEAFSKLSGERIRDCIEALKSLELQGAFSMSSGNIPYAIDLCDQTMVVSKRETTKQRKTFIRNIAVSLTRADARKRLMGGS